MPLYKRNEIPHNVIKELIAYDKDTGICTWKYRSDKYFKKSGFKNNQPIRWNKLFALKTAGTLNVHGYYSITILYITYKLHNVIWFYMTGKWPKEEVDHIDRIKTNNKWNNLRSANRSINSRNRGVSVSNKSGVVGVSWKKNPGLWRVLIGDGKKNIHVGYFKDFDDAVTARKQVEIKFGYNK